MSPRRLCCIPVLALVGCQSHKQAPPPAPVEVQAKDASGNIVAELRPLRPCRASVAGTELIVGGPPLLAQVGTSQWTGTAGANGTTYAKDGQRLARVYPVNDPNGAAVLDTNGVALDRIAVTGDQATITDGASVPVRKLVRTGPGTISIDRPALTVTGTDDLVLAALLTAQELVPEVRMLASCERVLVKGS